MTEGETLFYLREIRSHWSTSNVSAEKLAELEQAKLIERQAEPVPAVRLTTEGVRLKARGQRPIAEPTFGSKAQSRPQRKFRRQKQFAPAPKPLV